MESLDCILRNSENFDQIVPGGLELLQTATYLLVCIRMAGACLQWAMLYPSEECTSNAPKIWSTYLLLYIARAFLSRI